MVCISWWTWKSQKCHLWEDIYRHAYAYKAPTTTPVWVNCPNCRPLDSSVGSYSGLSQYTIDCSMGDIFRDGTASFFKWLVESREFFWLALIISNFFLPHFPVLSLLKYVVGSNSGRILLTDFCDISRSVKIWRWNFEICRFNKKTCCLTFKGISDMSYLYNEEGIYNYNYMKK